MIFEKKQVNYILEYISKLEKSTFPNILCGDFNADPNSDEIRLILGLTSPVYRTVLRDSWQITNPNDHGYTWSNENTFAQKLWSQIDELIIYLLEVRVKMVSATL